MKSEYDFSKAKNRNFMDREGQPKIENAVKHKLLFFSGTIERAEKEYEKKKRAFLREVKMSKETPTKKQLYYYEKLCKKYNLEKQELTSKLQARDEIDRIINEYSRDFENIDW